MFLKTISSVFLATSLTIAASAQEARPKPQFLPQSDKTVTYASAADIEAVIVQAKKERKDDAALVVGKVLQLTPYAAYLEYREPSTGPSDVGLHPKDDELVYVLEGSGTLVTGGTITGDRLRIEGGISQKISKGDFMIIPAGTPHWISHIDQTIVQMTIHLPRPLPAQ